VSFRKKWRVWCPECGRPFGRHQWGANRGKPIAAQHARPGAKRPPGLTSWERGRWMRDNACPGSLQYGRRVTDDEEARLRAAPSAAALRALRVLAGGEMSLRDFAEAAYPGADWSSTSRVGAHGVTAGAQAMRSAASRLAALVRSGHARVRFEGERSAARRLWSLSEAGSAALAGVLNPGRGPDVEPA